MPRSNNIWDRVRKPDPEDSKSCWIWVGASHSMGYGSFGRKLAHRVVYEAVKGPIPPGLDLDHICHIKKCVNPDHLRPVTHKQNHENHDGARVDSKSGIRGVYWVEHAKSWRVQVRHHQKQHHIGYYKSLEEADQAAKDARNRLFTHNNRDREDFSE